MTDLEKAMQLAADAEALQKLKNPETPYGNRKESDLEKAMRLADATDNMIKVQRHQGGIERNETELERCERLSQNPEIQPTVAQLRGEVQPTQNLGKGLWQQPPAFGYPSTMRGYEKGGDVETGTPPVLMGRRKAQKRALLVERMNQPVM